MILSLKILHYINSEEELEFIVSEWINPKYIKIIWLDKINNFDEVKLEDFTTDIAREKEYFDLLEKKNSLPKNYEDFEKIVLLSESLRKWFISDANLTDKEKIDLAKDTEKMSIMDVARYIEKVDDKVWRTWLNYSNIWTYEWPIEKVPRWLTWRLRLKDIVPNTHIELNSSYDKYNIDNVPDGKKDDVMKIIETMPEWGDTIVCRNAIKNPSFSSNKSFMVQNLTYKTAVIYYPWKEKASIIPINHWSWINWIWEVSNINWSHWTSLWSKELRAQGWDKYRLVVKWLEPLVEKFKFNRGEAMEHDPAEFWNSNDEWRLIRIHETKSSHRTTWGGCSGIESWNAKELYDAIKKAWWWAQEIFVSKI